jgi:hypothetical protein
MNIALPFIYGQIATERKSYISPWLKHNKFVEHIIQNFVAFEHVSFIALLIRRFVTLLSTSLQTLSRNLELNVLKVQLFWWGWWCKNIR